jgi:SAM-dependent methyltransferase
MTDWERSVRQTYDRVAAEYAARIYGELAHKPFDRAILDRFAELAAPLGPICDLGCGPGQVARYLHDRGEALRLAEQARGVVRRGPGDARSGLGGAGRGPGLEVFGIDLSPAMVEEARRLNPGLRFEQGTMLALDVADARLGGIAAFYAIVNVPRADQPRAFAECWRVLAPGGWLLLAVHVGAETIHLDEWWGTPVAVEFYFFEPAEIEARLRGSGFVVEETRVRDPYPEVEHPSRRAYLLARKPPAG